MADYITALLAPLGLYRLGAGGPLEAELAAYRTGIAFVEQAAAQLLKDTFVQTAGEEGLERWEYLLGIPLRRGVKEEIRRERILSSLAISPTDFTPQGVLNSLRGAGLAARLVEYPTQQRLLVIGEGFIGGFDTIYDVMRSAFQMLPAHLEADFDIGGMTWLQFAELYPDWNSFEEQLKDWEAFDTMLI